jgi:hypothetical protein
MADRYLTAKEVSERLRGLIVVRTLANWRCEGKGPPYRRFGNRIVYPEREFELWAKARQFTSTAEYKGAASPPDNNSVPGETERDIEAWWADRDSTVAPEGQTRPIRGRRE